MKSQSPKRKRQGRPPAAQRLERLKKTLSPGEWQERVASLMSDLASESAPSEMVTLTHAECEEMLAWYTADEELGKPVDELYPAVYHHLQTCSRCAGSYALLRVATGQTPTTDREVASTSSAALPFLNPTPDNAWLQRMAAQLLGAGAGISFLFNPEHLKNLFHGRTALALRSAGTGSAESVLLDDQMTLNDESFDVQALLVPSLDTPGRFHIQIQLSPLPSSKTHLRARLKWGEQEYTADLAGGKAELTHVSPPDLSRPDADEPSSDFQLTFETISNEPKPGD